MKYPQIPGLDITARTLFCIGRNYLEHAREMNTQVPEQPMVFLKSLSALCFEGTQIQLPPQSKNVHYEAELVVAIGKEGKNIPESEALDYIAGYGIGVDFTARDIQKKAKEDGHPWSVAKGFDTFAPVSNFLSTEEIPDPQDLHLELSQNNEIKQSGNTSEMIFPVKTLISYLSEIFTLYPGDLIFTGTPSGVGPVQSGDQIRVSLNSGLLKLSLSIA